jgi:hypothetical protein
LERTGEVSRIGVSERLRDLPDPVSPILQHPPRQREARPPDDLGVDQLLRSEASL